MNVRNLLMLLLLTLGLGHLSAEDAAAPSKAGGAADQSEATNTDPTAVPGSDPVASTNNSASVSSNKDVSKESLGDNNSTKAEKWFKIPFYGKI